MKVIVAISGASGVQYGIELLKALRDKKTETYLIISEWAKKIIQTETDFKPESVINTASHFYENDNLAAPVASGSFLVDGMVIVPCSIRTVGEIATAHTASLITRAADNMLKMRKKLIVGVRETPLSTPALQQLHQLSLAGAVVLPLAPAFYHKPRQLNDLFLFINGKILDCLGIDNHQFKRWS